VANLFGQGNNSFNRAGQAPPLTDGTREFVSRYNDAMPTLNERAWELCDAMVADADALGIAVQTMACGTRLIDCGVKAVGSIETGRRLAEVCMAGLGSVKLKPSESGELAQQRVIAAPNPTVVACMASQYAGWEIKGDGFFAMGSGPMRAAAGHEKLFDDIGHREKPDCCVGVLESNKLPPDSVCVEIATKCGIAPQQLTLLAARTSSPAGTVQIVARSVETGLHKLHALGFDLERIVTGVGSAPLPPIAGDDLTAIGRTNDAILYGAIVTLLVEGDDASLEEIGPRVPSNMSPDYGRPFGEIFKRNNGDFYRIDPMLFSPAKITFYNVDTQRMFQYGRTAPKLLAESFANT
jgi:methenyltetrahydromethanopterin cyclohydrolase